MNIVFEKMPQYGQRNQFELRKNDLWKKLPRDIIDNEDINFHAFQELM